MKSINAKRIAAIAASLAMGIAVAGQGVTFGNIPIINTAGQPVVQIVVGSTAMPSDGVVAANIAAAIGSLAHTTQNITATVNGRSGVSCVVTTPTCTLSNQQVWLGEKGLTVGAGSYGFTALIGSVVNGGVLNSGNIANTKSLLGGPTQGNQYVYADSGNSPFAISTSPNAPSAYEGVGVLPASSVIANTNGGGLQFTRFTNQSYDNIVKISNSQLPGLLSNSGTYQESENIWVGGFPVFNQQSNVSNFALLDTQVAYQASFGKPIQNKTNGANTNALFTLLGQNWTVYNLLPPVGVHGTSSNNFVVGGNVTLAQASTPLTTVYVGHNITSGPFTVVLNDLSYPNSSGGSRAAISVFKNGVQTNVTSIGPGTTQTINASGTKLFVSVTQTFPGLYAYQKWAKIQLFSNTFNVSSGKDFNEVTNGHKWVSLLRWTTNQTTTSFETSANAALQSIIVYSNQSSATMLTPGQSVNIIANPAVWALKFVGDSLGTPGSGNNNYDQLSFTTSSTGAITYQNNGGSSTALGAGFVQTFPVTAVVTTGTGATTFDTVNDTSITEAANLFTVSSSLPAAFSVTPISGATAPASDLQSAKYNLDTYQFVPANTVDPAGVANILSQTGNFVNAGLYATLQNNGLSANYVTTTNPLTVQISGYRSVGGSLSTASFTFNGFNTQTLPGAAFVNVTGINMQTSSLPNPGANVLVYESSNVVAQVASNSVLLGKLLYQGPAILYKVPTLSYYQQGKSGSVNYTGENNNVNLGLTQASPSNSVARAQYYTFTVPEITVSTSTSPNANVVIGITNSSNIGSTPLYWLNSSASGNNAVQYVSTQGSAVKALQGFRTERGSAISSIGTTSITMDEARSVDGLIFAVGPSGSNSTSTTKQYGPYGVGQATNIANVTIAKVNATCTFSTTSCSVTGLANLTATPSVSTAVVGSSLNTATTPLAVLDAQANNASTLIVVGSKYVNSVAGQIFNQNPSFAQSFGPTGPNSVVVKAFGTNRILVAGYSANQTVQAGNEFIQALLAGASS